VKFFTPCLALLTLVTFTVAKINIVTSLPDLADMAERIGGEKVHVTSLASGREDLHAVAVRPSFLPLLNRADILISLGLDAEHSWLPALVYEARNKHIFPGQPGWVQTNPGVAVLEVPTILDRSQGEQHPDGNPHYNIGPQCGKIMAQNIFNALCATAQHHTPYFQQQYNHYIQDIDSTISSLRARTEALRGVWVIGYHPDIAYLCSFYEMNIFGYIEPMAGVAPTAGHLQQLRQQARQSDVRLIIHNQSQSPKIPHKLGRDLSCSVVELANSVGAKRGIDSWIALQNYNAEVLLKALEQIE